MESSSWWRRVHIEVTSQKPIDYGSTGPLVADTSPEDPLSRIGSAMPTASESGVPVPSVPDLSLRARASWRDDLKWTRTNLRVTG